MPRDMLGDAATLGDGTDTGKARVIMRNGKYPAVPAQSPVFADYAVGDVEQADVGHHARFLAVDVYPLVFVEVGADIREEVRTFTQRGVADLYDLYQADSAFMKGAAIADKVIGKGAAALMVLGGFKTVYADIISTPALALLCEAGIETTFAQEVPHIINRDKTGWCPLETACMELNTVEEMYPVIQNFISRIRAK